jgi:hypothetical protein
VVASNSFCGLQRQPPAISACSPASARRSFSGVSSMSVSITDAPHGELAPHVDAAGPGYERGLA